MDLALIMKELTKHEDYIKIATTQVYKIPPNNKSKEERVFSNGNKLLQKYSSYKYPPCDAGKTGYTTQSKHSYVATAIKNGQRLIVALVHDENKTIFTDAINLFEYGFNNFELLKLYGEGSSVSNYSIKDKSISLVAAESFYYVKEKSSTLVPQYAIVDKDLSSSSFKAGDKILEAEVTMNNKPIGTLKLSAGESYSASIFAANSLVTNKFFGNLYTKILLVISSILILLLTIRFYKKRRK